MSASARQLRWTAVAVVCMASALNYLDRSVLSALAPTIIKEFHLTAAQYGWIISAFSLSYMISSPVVGLLIDHFGVRRGAALVVAAWSGVGIVTGFVQSFTGLILCRSALGVAEAGGIPAVGKGNAMYLLPSERALGSAVSQVGLTLGIVGAPLLTAWLSQQYGWRMAFVAAGVLGLLWVPIWWYVSRIAPVVGEEIVGQSVAVSSVVRDARWWWLLAANGLMMVVYSLWTGWTTQFLVTRYGLAQNAANVKYAWIPPNCAALGGFVGGWLALKLINSGRPVVQSRLLIAWIGAVGVLSTALTPMMPTPAGATLMISVSYFFALMISVNYYSLPVDLFGPGSSAFSISGLVASYGLMQTIVSPLIGKSSETIGWQPVCLAAAVLPLVSAGILQLALRR